MATLGMRTTNGLSAMAPAAAIDPFVQAQTIFSGADPAIADLSGTSAIMQGTYPQASNAAIAASWMSAVPWFGSPSASAQVSGASASNPPPSTSATTAAIIFVIAIVLLMAGAFAIVGPSAEAM